MTNSINATKPDLVKNILLIIFIVIVLSNLCFRIAYDYSYNKTVTEYLDEKDDSINFK